MVMQGAVGVKLNSRISDLIDRILSEGEKTENGFSVPEDGKAILRVDKARGSLSARGLQLVVAANKKTKGPPLFASNDEIKIDLPKLPEPEEESAEKRKRREYLKMRQEERNYNKMIFGKETNPIVEDTLSMGNQLNTFKFQMSMGFNVMFSMIATFGMGYYIAQNLGKTSSQALMFGLVAAIVVLIMEMTLFIMRAVQVEGTLEAPPSKQKENLAKMRSGALVTPIDDSLSSATITNNNRQLSAPESKSNPAGDGN